MFVTKPLTVFSFVSLTVYNQGLKAKAMIICLLVSSSYLILHFLRISGRPEVAIEKTTQIGLVNFYMDS